MKPEEWKALELGDVVNDGSMHNYLIIKDGPLGTKIGVFVTVLPALILSNGTNMKKLCSGVGVSSDYMKVFDLAAQSGISE